MKPKVLVLRAAGTNCDLETAFAFQSVGAVAERVHLNRLIESPTTLGQFQILAIPGGFSFGDDISAGRIVANQLMLRLGEVVRGFVAAGKPVIGICNGFQILVKTDLLPGKIPGIDQVGQHCTLTDNDTGRFIARWVRVRGAAGKCIWTAGVGEIELPIAHGEGKFLCGSPAIREALHRSGQVAVTYAGENPNGSTDDIAGVCDTSGLVFGLMPHPERHLTPQQHYNFAGLPKGKTEGDGVAIFRNAVRHVGG